MMNLAAILGILYSNIVPFVVLLGVLVFVHELGHFLVARMCGVRVEVFSLGFGKKIFNYKKGDTNYCVSLIPLGGYVKMFGEQGSEAVLTDDDKKVSYSHKTVFQRMAIVLAGPLMNFFFAFMVFSFLVQIGEKQAAPIVAQVDEGSPAEQMGFKEGDRIADVGGEKILSFDDFQKILNLNKDKTVAATVLNGGQTRTINLSVTTVDNPNIFSLETKLGQIEGISPITKAAFLAVLSESEADKAGFKTGDLVTEVNGVKIGSQKQFIDLLTMAPADGSELKVKYERAPLGPDKERLENASPVTGTISFVKKKDFSISEFGFDKSELYIENILKDSPAAKAQLQRFDKVVSINGVKVAKWTDISEKIKAFDGKEPINFIFMRDGKEIEKKISPSVTTQTNAFGQEDKKFAIGITSFIIFTDPELVMVESSSIFDSFGKGFSRSIDISVMTAMSFVKIFQGKVSTKNVGGMVSIGKAAKDSFEQGLRSFLSTMGVLSISLFILNLLPIPVLDGGHMVFYTIELIKGSPLSLKKMEMAQQIGFAILIGLMILAQFNDIMRFLFKS